MKFAILSLPLLSFGFRQCNNNNCVESNQVQLDQQHWQQQNCVNGNCSQVQQSCANGDCNQWSNSSCMDGGNCQPWRRQRQRRFRQQGSVAREWQCSTHYNVGDVVVFNGMQYQVIQQHTSQMDWQPWSTPALFSRIN